MKKKLLCFNSLYKSGLIVLALLFAFKQTKAQTLAAGDIAFIGYDFGTVDGFSFIALKPLPAGETIYFSEQGWTATGWATNTETHLKWVIPTTVPCGTIISIIETSADAFTVSGTSGVTIALNSNFNLSGGDQILAYQSTSGVAPVNPIFIAGVHGDYNSTNYDPATTWNASNVSGAPESIVPTGLTNGVNCISLFPAPGPEVANSKYTGTLTGTAAALRASINNPANWAHDGTASLGITPLGYAAPNVNCTVAVNPTVSSSTATGIGAVKATLGGEVTADGGGAVTERGIVWSIGLNPTTSDNKVIMGSGTGSFSNVVAALPANSTINFRAFATNSAGTAYGTNLSFTTSAALAASSSFTTVSCNGGGNGTATVVAAAGITPYTYAWSPSGGTNPTASGLSVGAYTCTITDGEGTAITRSFTITQPPAMSAVTAKTNVSCNGSANGTATIVPSGGVGPYTYSWSPSGGTAATATGLAVGNYTVTVTDANTCTITRGFTITQPPALVVTAGLQMNVACNGGTNGAATVSVTGGVPAYSYSWSPSGGTSATATGLAAGTYVCTVTDANSCTKTQSFTIVEPTALTATTSQTNVACNGGTNGSATVVPSGGTGPLTYSWAPSGGTAATATGLAAGTYVCTITDANTCSITRSVTITAPNAITATTSFTNISCNGAANGTATVVAAGGTGSLTYSWAPSGGTAATATGLGVGVYTCTITDANACSITRSVTITQPAPLTASTAFTTIPCNGGTNGSAMVNPSGGTSPYTYSWAPSGGTSATASGLAAGTYTCTITDANGCFITRSATITEPTALTATTASTSILCNGGTNGSASVTASGGTGPYTYAWAPSGGTAPTASGLAVGTYTCTITDANACFITRSVTINQPTALTATTASTNVLCNGGTNGSASVTASGGTGPYTYSWAPSGGTAATASGLALGTYTCTITDANGCFITRSVTINQPAPLTASTAFTTIPCNGGTNGSAMVNPSGGTGPYTYAWAPSGGTAATASGLAAGTYTCTITDANGCFITRSATITEPAPLTASAAFTTISCNGGTNGTAMVNPSGGTGPYTYSWAPSGGTAPTATGLAAGTYTCTITDANGCFITRSATITEPTALTATTASSNVSCNGGTNGSASVTASGGTGPYTYSWAPSGGTAATASGLALGTYTCTITDANGCFITRSVTINQPTALTATTASTSVLCNGGTNGSASVTASGGTGPYTYAWAPSGGTAPTASGLGVGVYTCTITDANGCFITRSVTINQPTALTATTASTSVLCNGGTNGSASVTASGGTGPYTYSWAPSGGTAATASGLAEGVYTCTITDVNACFITRSITITQPLAITATTSSTNISCNGGTNGTATVVPAGGVGPYTYSWAPSGGTAATASGLAEGVYTCTITDANACFITRSITITQPTAITASITATNSTNGSNGTATVSPAGGTGSYTYFWSPGGGTAATASGLSKGVYTCTITDANACSIVKSITVFEETVISGFAIANQSYGSNATLTAPTSNSNASFSYSSSNTTVASINGNVLTALKPGTSTITVTQAATANYTAATATATVTVLPKNITVSLNGTPLISKTYDGNATATLLPANYTLNGLVGSDEVTITGTASYNNKNAGTAKTITAGNFVLAGAEKDYYILTTVNTTVNGNILSRNLTATAAPVSKTYDGSNTATINFDALTNLVNGEQVQVSYTSATYPDKNTGTNKAISITGLSLSGADFANYTLNSFSTTGNILAKALTITADNKERFAGNANPVLTASYNGFITGETNAVLITQPSLNTTATISSAIGDYPITVNGASAANYNISYVAGNLKVKGGAPTNILLAGVTLYENSAAGTNAGTLSSTSDDPTATFTYTLVAGAGDTDNTSFAISGNKLNTTASLDFETKQAYSVRVKSTTQYGLSLEKTFIINLTDVNEAPTLAAINNQTICFTNTGQSVALSGITPGPETTQTTTLSVSSNNPNLFESLTVDKTGTTGTVNYRIKAGAIAGTATVTVTVKDNGGTANGGIDTYSRTFTITVNALPVISINSDKGIQISKGESVLLVATGGTSFTWGAHSSIKNGLNSAMIEVRPRETTTYTVTVTNASGCSETKTFTLTVLDDYAKIKATNIMSPDGDGINDKWLIDNIDFYPNNEVKIYDKSGRLIYGKKGYDNSWDATLNGLPLAEGTYYYVIDFGTNKQSVKGFITVVRKEQTR